MKYKVKWLRRLCCSFHKCSKQVYEHCTYERKILKASASAPSVQRYRRKRRRRRRIRREGKEEDSQ
jgi:hypothetical protein